jgi:hypothetical protein
LLPTLLPLLLQGVQVQRRQRQQRLLLLLVWVL